MQEARRVKIASCALLKKIRYGGSEIHLVGRKKEPLILEATKRGEMWSRSAVVNVFCDWGRMSAPGSWGPERECLRRLILVPVSDLYPLPLFAHIPSNGLIDSVCCYCNFAYSNSECLSRRRSRLLSSRAWLVGACCASLRGFLRFPACRPSLLSWTRLAAIVFLVLLLVFYIWRV